MTLSSIDLQVLIGCATGVIAFATLTGAILIGSVKDEIENVLKTWSTNKVERVKLEIELEKVKVDKKICLACQTAFEGK